MRSLSRLIPTHPAMTVISRLSTRAAACAAVTAAPPVYGLLRLVLSRFHSDATSAAAVQPLFDYDYSSDDIHGPADHDRVRNRPEAALLDESEGSFTMRGWQLVFLGSPGTKKHVYAEKLSKVIEVPHISMASLVRQELSPRSSIYRKIAYAVNCGKLVPEDIIFGLLSKRLEDGYYRGESGFILDGIPRSYAQAKILDQLAVIDLVLNFRWTQFFSRKHHEDAEGLWEEKLRVYAEQSKPVEEFYRKQKKVVDIQVGCAPEETWQGLLAALHLQHLNAFRTPQKIQSGFPEL